MTDKAKQVRDALEDLWHERHLISNAAMYLQIPKKHFDVLDEALAFYLSAMKERESDNQKSKDVIKSIIENVTKQPWSERYVSKNRPNNTRATDAKIEGGVMKCTNGHTLKEGDIIYSSYGIPPKYIEGRLYKQENRWRVRVLTGDKPSDVYLSNFKQHLGEFYKKETEND